MRSIDRWFVVLPLLVSQSVIFASEPDAQVEAEFQEICQLILDSYDPFYGQRRLAEGNRLLGAGVESRAELAALKGALGREELKQGQVDVAIELLGEALSLGETAGLNETLLLDLRVYLGLAHLQAAEDENCLQNHSAASCIIPFQREAIHQLRDHTRKAGDNFLRVAEKYPTAMQTLWLLNLARMVSGDFPQGVPQQFRLPPGALDPETSFRGGSIGRPSSGSVSWIWPGVR